MRIPLSLAALLLASCAGAPDRTAETPPVTEDLDAWLALCDHVLEYSHDKYGDVGIGGSQLDFTESDFRWLREFVRDRCTEELVAATRELDDAELQRAVRGFMESTRDGAPVEHAVYQEGAIIEYRASLGVGEMYAEAAASVGWESETISLPYERVDGEWRLMKLPSVIWDLPTVSLPRATFGEPWTDQVEVSPIVLIRDFAAGAIPAEAIETYAEMGVAPPRNSPWRDVVWRGVPRHYPGCDTLGHTDPIAPPGTPDEFAQLEAVAVDKWLPFMGFEDDAESGRMLPSDPVAFLVEQSAPSEFLGQVVRVLARPEILIRQVRLRVDSTEAPGEHCLALVQPLTWKEQQDAPIVPAGASEAEVAEALKSMTDSRAGARPVEGASVQDLVDTLDLLAAQGVTRPFVAVLPEGYTPFAKS